jgi:hypothetical protein
MSAHIRRLQCRELHLIRRLRPKLKVEGVAVEWIGYGGSAMWISIFAIAIAMAIFLNVAAVMTNVRSAKV